MIPIPASLQTIRTGPVAQPSSHSIDHGQSVSEGSGRYMNLTYCLQQEARNNSSFLQSKIYLEYVYCSKYGNTY